MPWVRLDDRFTDHPKVDALSDGAFRLHVAGMCHAARYLTDGMVPADRVNRLTPNYRPAHLNELVERALCVKHGVAYEIHNFTVWNKSKAWWDDKRRKDAERLAKWRAQAPRDEEGRFAASE